MGSIGEGQQVAGAEAGIEIFQVAEAADEQTGADQQQQRQRYLRGYQRLAEPHRASAGDGADLILKRPGQIGTGGLQRGHQARK